MHSDSKSNIQLTVKYFLILEMVGGANAGSGAEAEEMAKQKVRGSACRRFGVGC